MNFFEQLFLGAKTKTKSSKPDSALKKQKETISEMWKGEKYPDFGIERVIRLLCILSNYLFPSLYVREFSGRYGWQARKLAMDCVTIINFLVPLLVLSCGWYENTIVVYITTYLSIGTLSYVINLIILQSEYSKPGSYIRSIICFALNYIQIILCFSVIYMAMSPESFSYGASKLHDVTHMVYYSFITAATVGFGDITPKSTMAITLALFQICISMLFLYVVFTTFVANIGQRTYANMPPKPKKK